jgi:hypothetical protein
MEEDISTLHVLIFGPFETPYEGGFFHFVLRCPPSYPFRPPRVRLMTTGDGAVRFNPNLYANGKVNRPPLPPSTNVYRSPFKYAPIFTPNATPPALVFFIHISVELFTLFFL